MSRRRILLDASAEAGRLHGRHKSKEVIQSKGGGVDVFGTILQLSIPLLFRPLDKLLGAFVPKPTAGIIITTERNLAVQRYTASHELGHFILGHAGSLDDESILNRTPFSGAQYDIVEAAADAFAASFLMPKWLFEIHAERQGWVAESFDNPSIVYQLALRIGASYEATCRSLARYNVIESRTLQDHLSIAPKKIKQELVGGREISDWHANVWVLSDRDQGMLIQGGPKDLFLVRLKENSGAGYLWNAEQIEREGFVLVSDELHVPEESEGIGGAVDRVLLAASQSEASGKLDLKQTRPWDPSADCSGFTLTYELYGKETGLPRAQRGKVAAG
jgi:Zn-dependent peptidase ImmA (M78 family)